MKVLMKAGLAFLPAVVLALAPAAPAQMSLNVSINTAPPVLPEYEQPPCPEPGYLWEPGYWAWGQDGYYWVPGVWVEPPQPGLLWTPGYWAFENGDYTWNDGYWAPEVGFYGGVDYGFGYPGQGFYGGMWQGNAFRYDVAVWHVGSGFHDTYREPERYHPPYNSRASFNGRGGIEARPTQQEERAMHARHVQMTEAQRGHMQSAAQNRQDWYRQNHGHPQQAAMARVQAGNEHRPAMQGRPSNRPGEARPGETHGRPSGARPEASRPQAGNYRQESRAQRTNPGAREGNRNARPEQQRAQPMERPQAPVRTNRNRPQPQQRPSRPGEPGGNARPHPETRRHQPAPQRQARPQQRPESRPQPRQEQRPQRPGEPGGHPRPQHQERPAARPGEPHPAEHPDKPHDGR